MLTCPYRFGGGLVRGPPLVPHRTGSNFHSPHITSREGQVICHAGSKSQLQPEPESLPLYEYSQQGNCGSEFAPVHSRRHALAQAALSAAGALLSPLICSASIAAPASARAIDVLWENPEERDITILSSGVLVADVHRGGGEPIEIGDMVVANVIGMLEDGTVFLDTLAQGGVLTFSMGHQDAIVTNGLGKAVLDMRTGGVRFALVPALLGYGDAGEIMPLAKVPANALLFYRIELLRFQQDATDGHKLWCEEEDFPCTESALAEGEEEENEDENKPLYA